MPRVVHFEISSGDPAKAVKFYGEIFGWTFQKWDGPQEYWLVRTGPDGQPGINGGLLRGQIQTVNTIDVADLDATLSSVTSKGGKVAMPKFAVPGVGHVAYCQDPEGNLFGLLQPDASAK
jgi:predicted enzyme related to lactoylglutathione lyase